jgi:hypothetical protein
LGLKKGGDTTGRRGVLKKEDLAAAGCHHDRIRRLRRRTVPL